MLTISNNCSGGWCYRLNHEPYNNPFMWMVCPYKSMYNVMSNFSDINWGRFTLHKSTIAHNTFMILVDGLIELHYVHYVFNPNATTLRIHQQGAETNSEADTVGNYNIIAEREVEYCKIWEYVVNKYIERTARMVKLTENPSFVIMEDTNKYNYNMELAKLANHPCKYKRAIITTQSFSITNQYTTVFKLQQLSNPLYVIQPRLSAINLALLN